jgi:hypothetical protein
VARALLQWVQLFKVELRKHGDSSGLPRRCALTSFHVCWPFFGRYRKGTTDPKTSPPRPHPRTRGGGHARTHAPPHTHHTHRPTRLVSPPPHTHPRARNIMCRYRACSSVGFRTQCSFDLPYYAPPPFAITVRRQSNGPPIRVSRTKRGVGVPSKPLSSAVAVEHLECGLLSKAVIAEGTPRQEVVADFGNIENFGDRDDLLGALLGARACPAAPSAPQRRSRLARWRQRPVAARSAPPTLRSPARRKKSSRAPAARAPADPPFVLADRTVSPPC